MPDVSALYEDRTSQDYAASDDGLALGIKRFVFGKQARRLLRDLPDTPRKVADFGCGSGLFTRSLADALGDRATVYGFDFFSSAPRGMGRANYRSFDEAASFLGQMDLVLCMHVLEHDDDPGILLKKATTLLRPGGLLVAEVPNMVSAWAGLFGKAWDNWYLPFHRVHFTAESFEALIRRHGFDILMRGPQSVPSMGRSLARLAGRENSLPFLLTGAALQPVQWLGEKATRRPTALRIVARHSGGPARHSGGMPPGEDEQAHR